jgi:competence protein ComEC
VPDVLVAADGQSAAVRGADGRYRILGKGDDFVVETWLRADGDPRKTDDPGLKDGVRCDPLGCIATLAGGRIVALSQSVYALADDCARAEVVVSSFRSPASCGDKATVVDRRASAQGGSVALHAKEGETGPSAFTMTTAYPPLRRPFMPPAGGQ